MTPNSTLVEGTPGAERPSATQPISEVTDVRINEVKSEEGEAQEGQEGSRPENASGVHGWAERGQDALLNKAPAIRPQGIWEWRDMETDHPSIVAGYLGVPEERAVSLMTTIMRMKQDPNIKNVLLLKCQVTGDWKIYFVGQHDSVTDAVERYFKFMKEEGDVFKVQWQLKKSILDDPRGFTEARLHQLICELPTNLKTILACFEGFFDDAKGLDRLLRHYPGLRAVQ